MKWHCISGMWLLFFINTKKQRLVNAVGLPATDSDRQSECKLQSMPSLYALGGRDLQARGQ